MEALQAYPDPLREQVGLPLGPYGMYCTTSAIDPFGVGDDVLATKLAKTKEHLMERLPFQLTLCVPREDLLSSQYEAVEGFDGPQLVFRWKSEDPLQRTIQMAPWCDWRPTEDKKGMEVKGADKFPGYKEWLQVVVDHFLQPWGYELSGQVHYRMQWGQEGYLVVEQQQVHEVITRPSNPY